MFAPPVGCLRVGRGASGTCNSCDDKRLMLFGVLFFFSFGWKARIHLDTRPFVCVLEGKTG